MSVVLQKVTWVILTLNLITDLRVVHLFCKYKEPG